MYAQLRGVVKKQIPQIVEQLIKLLLLSDHKDKMAGNLRYADLSFILEVYILRDDSL